MSHQQAPFARWGINMNILGLKCTSKKTIAVVIVKDQIIPDVFVTPAVFDKPEDVADIVNWHRENIMSLMDRFNIDVISIKKSETVSFRGLKETQRRQLYVEGMALSLAGIKGIKNSNYFKTEITRKLKADYFEKSAIEIAQMFELQGLPTKLTKALNDDIRDPLLAALCERMEIAK